MSRGELPKASVADLGPLLPPPGSSSWWVEAAEAEEERDEETPFWVFPTNELKCN